MLNHTDLPALRAEFKLTPELLALAAVFGQEKRK